MNIEVRNLKFAQFASQETNCFEATLYIGGKRVGTARNEGRGGATHIEPRECAERLNIHVATLPRVVSDIKDEEDPSGFFTYAPTGESLVDDLVAEALVERGLKKALGKRILFTVSGKAGIFQTEGLKADALARTLTDPALAQKLKADKILNLLPLAEAVLVYKDGARTEGSGTGCWRRADVRGTWARSTRVARQRAPAESRGPHRGSRTASCERKRRA